MQIRTTLLAGLGLLALAGCADPNASPAARTTTTTSVTRDGYGNPIGSSTVVRDAYGNVVSAAPGSPGYVAPGAPGYVAPAYGSSASAYGQPVYPNGAVAAAQDPRCQPTMLHQDRQGGNDYNPYRGAPSC